MGTEVVDQLLSTTRAVRLRLDLDRDVPAGIIEDCLRLAIQAPTAGGAQNWRWLIVRDAATRSQIGRLFREVGDEYMRHKVAAAGEAARHGAMARSIASAQHLIDVIERVPVFVIPCMLGRPEGRNAADAVFYGGIFPAVWNFQLALRSRGLGTTLTTYHLERETEAAEILGIPADVTQVALLPIAYTKGSKFGRAPRQPVTDVAYAERWGSPLG